MKGKSATRPSPVRVTPAASPDAVELLASGGNRERIARELKRLGFNYVTIDLEGFRSGSMNLQITRKKSEA
jgi:PP-loop superfamily ATP-utilizing enzyme